MSRLNDIDRNAFGPNRWLVDEMYRRYREDPEAVSEAWREFFEDYAPAGVPVEKEERERAPEAPPVRPAGPVPSAPEGAAPLRGLTARIAENMEASLGVPTATSVRAIPAKLLEENRRIVNRYLQSHRGGKVSFTHIVGYAVLRALEARPAMKAAYAELEGKPHVVHNKRVNFGLAVDLERQGQRTLMVPNIKDAHVLDFRGFFQAYEEVIRKVRAGDLSPDDFQGTTVTITNPGTVGTSQSVPRLLPGQGLIVGVGAIAYPPEYGAADPKTIARLGVSTTLTLTSTYDHRVIQGAESGEFLAYVHELLLGSDRFYDEVFASLRVAYEPARWSRDIGPPDDPDAMLEKQSRVIQLVNQYRVRGHLLAELNPIRWEVLSYPELDLSHYSLTVWDLDREFVTDGLPGARRQTLRQIVETLREAYCGTVGVEYMHIADPEQKRWIQERVESGWEELPLQDQKRILDRLNAAEAFERFLHSKYTGHRRYSLEGAESVIPMLDVLLEQAAESQTVEVVMGMAHRGRLNVLANVVSKPLSEIFQEFQGDVDETTVQGSGDVKYHLGQTGRFVSRGKNEIGVVLAANAAHLESVDPVVLGMAAAKQDVLGRGGKAGVLPVLLHGDAAFAGQGVVAETFNMCNLRGYRVGGTVHIVINNQIGFTTVPEAARSSTYPTDIAKMVQAPIFHVNGDDPEACVRVIRLAFAYRQEFHKDVVIDLVCYRRHGHQEVDNPSFTQPLMYQRVEDHRSVRKLYTEHLVNRGALSLDDAERVLEDFRARLANAFDETRESRDDPPARESTPRERPSRTPVSETGVARARLELIHNALTTWPSDFEPHPKLARMLERRRDALEQGAIDWALAEALAFGSLCLEGFAVRLSGQDSRRGTFSQRHSVLIDYHTEREHVPLNHLSDTQAPFLAYDSLLSEYAVLGFEYGYSVANGDTLVCWEAQFGDFANGAQIVVDQYIAPGEDKWGQESKLVLLLPHGYEGQGPEHSSARLERFLTAAAEGSIEVTQPTTPAQYFHVLRRQMHLGARKPLVVLTPKSLLRAPDARSATGEFVRGRFEEVLDDSRISDRSRVKRILLCTGKVAYQLAAERERRGRSDQAIVRVEQLSPYPREQLVDIFGSYPNANEVRWVQEEPENMGAWPFVHARLGRVRDGLELTHVARPAGASPATGSQVVHEQEQKELFDRAFAPPRP